MELERRSVWRNVDETEYQKIFSYNERYKNFLDESKTERETCEYIIRKCEENGFVALEKVLDQEVKPGDKIYFNNKNKSAVVMVVGEDIHEGMNIVGAHIDSPRLDIKADPVFESDELCFFKTHYYGGIKKYQWPTIPLSLHGVVFDKTGKKIDICIGEKEDDPVFFVTDLLAHLSKDLMQKPLGEAIEGEKLNIVVGHDSYAFKDEKDNPVKKSVLKYLKEEYGMDEKDFSVAELEVVPASHARDVGFDRAMIAGHGHDDRVCAYAALEAILATENPQRTAVALFADKEEIGSYGNTGMQASFFKNMVAEVLNTQGQYSDLILRRVFAKSKVLSADVTTAIDPHYPEATDPQNTAITGHGVALSKYTGVRGKSSSNDANAEFLSELRLLFDQNGIIWQTGELGKVDQGGGGTIAEILARDGCEVVDLGCPVLSMHAPVELISKADSYMTAKAYTIFLK